MSEGCATDAIVSFRPVKGEQHTINQRLAIQRALWQNDVLLDVSFMDKCSLLGNSALQHAFTQLVSEQFAEDLVVKVEQGDRASIVERLGHLPLFAL